MPVETTYTHLRQRLASILKQVAEDHEVVIVRRKTAKDVALVPADELASLTETAHLLRSPANARRLLRACGHIRPSARPILSAPALRASTDSRAAIASQSGKRRRRRSS